MLPATLYVKQGACLARSEIVILVSVTEKGFCVTASERSNILGEHLSSRIGKSCHEARQNDTPPNAR